MTALAFTDLSVRFGMRTVLDAVTCHFAAGQVTGLLGPNGAGKTTLLRAALGIVPPSSGSIALLGRPFERFTREARAQTLAYLPQTNEAHWPLTARRMVALGRLPHRVSLGTLSAVDEAAISVALERCDALALADRRMDQLSSGERARVMLARALATATPVVLADEPAAHLDPSHQLRLMALLTEEARRGTAVVVTLHDLSLAARFCDRITVLHQGRVAAEGTPGQALTDTLLAEVFNVGVARLRAENGTEMLAVTPI